VVESAPSKQIGKRCAKALKADWPLKRRLIFRSFALILGEGGMAVIERASWRTPSENSAVLTIVGQVSALARDA
jgi:hypothetical protein